MCFFKSNRTHDQETCCKSVKSIETLKHNADKRKNIPTAELQSVLNDAE
jgi:hypothetical protein